MTVTEHVDPRNKNLILRVAKNNEIVFEVSVSPTYFMESEFSTFDTLDPTDKLKRVLQAFLQTNSTWFEKIENNYKLIV